MMMRVIYRCPTHRKAPHILTLPVLHLILLLILFLLLLLLILRELFNCSTLPMLLLLLLLLLIDCGMDIWTKSRQNKLTENDFQLKLLEIFQCQEDSLYKYSNKLCTL